MRRRAPHEPRSKAGRSKRLPARDRNGRFVKTPLLEFRPVSAAEPQELEGGLPEPSDLPRERWWEASDLSWDADNQRRIGEEGAVAREVPTATVDPPMTNVDRAMPNIVSTARQAGTTPDGPAMGTGTDELPLEEQTPLEQRASQDEQTAPGQDKQEGSRPGPLRSWWRRGRTHRTRDEKKIEAEPVEGSQDHRQMEGETLR